MSYSKPTPEEEDKLDEIANRLAQETLESLLFKIQAELENKKLNLEHFATMSIAVMAFISAKVCGNLSKTVVEEEKMWPLREFMQLFTENFNTFANLKEELHAIIQEGEFPKGGIPKA